METLHRAIPSYRSPSRSPSSIQRDHRVIIIGPGNGLLLATRMAHHIASLMSDIGRKSALHPDSLVGTGEVYRSPVRGGDDRGPGNQAAYYQPPMPGPPAYPSNNQGYYSDSLYQDGKQPYGQSPGPPTQQMSPRPNNPDPSYPSPRPTFQGPSYTQLQTAPNRHKVL